MNKKNTVNLLQDESLSQKLIKKWFWLYFFSYLTAPLGYLVRLFISNSPEVSVADFWVMYSIVSLIAFLYTYNDLWLTESLQYFLPRFYIKKEYNHIKTSVLLSLWAQISTWIIISLILRFWSDWLAINYFHSENAALILKYFCIYFIGNNLFQVLQTIFNAFQKTFDYQFVEFVRWCSIFAFTLFCFFSWRWTIERYSLNRVLWLWIGIIIASLLYRKYHSILMQWEFQLDKVMVKKYVKYALWAFIWSSIGNLFWQIIQQMVLYFIGPANAWYYSNFLSLFYIGTTLIWPIMALIFPIVSELIEKNDKKKLSLLYWFFYSYFSILILSFSTLFIVLWKEIAIALFGNDYLISWILLSQAWIFLLFSLLSSFNYSVLAWMWKVKERVYITWIACLLTIIVSYLWIKFFDIYWACLAFWLSNIFTWGLSFYLLQEEHYEFSLNWKFIIKNLIAFSVLWCWIYFFKDNFIQIDWNRWYIILKLIIIWAIFYLLVWLCNIDIIKWLKKEVMNLKW